MMQEDRKRARARLGSRTTEKPMRVLEWMADQFGLLEKRIVTLLDLWSEHHEAGPWLRAQKGVGPVLAAGFLSLLDIERASTAGAFWKFCGVPSSGKWLKGQKRPWCADARRLCFLAGQSFMKVSNRDDAFYGALYKQLKAEEWERNLSGEHDRVGRVDEFIARFKPGALTPDLRKWVDGEFNRIEPARKSDDGGDLIALRGLRDPGMDGVRMLPPSLILSRARWRAVTLFLSHLHQVWYEVHYGRSPAEPYAFAVLGHAHKVNPPPPWVG
jgi:hypothetical protein